jgi:hypothetical protein
MSRGRGGLVDLHFNNISLIFLNGFSINLRHSPGEVVVRDGARFKIKLMCVMVYF